MDKNPYGREVKVNLGWQDGKLRLPDQEELRYIQNMSRKVRRHVINIKRKAGTVHVGGSFSAVEIMVAL